MCTNCIFLILFQNTQVRGICLIFANTVHNYYSNYDEHVAQDFKGCSRRPLLCVLPGRCSPPPPPKVVFTLQGLGSRRLPLLFCLAVQGLCSLLDHSPSFPAGRSRLRPTSPSPPLRPASPPPTLRPTSPPPPRSTGTTVTKPSDRMATLLGLKKNNYKLNILILQVRNVLNFQVCPLFLCSPYSNIYSVLFHQFP